MSTTPSQSSVRGRSHGAPRSRRPGWPLLSGRRRWATAASVVLLVGLGWYGLVAGEVHVPAHRVVAALTGRASGGDAVVVLQWRLPRVVLAVLLGAALGLSGALFQVVTRNPLGSPDVLGFTTGSYTGALLVMLLVLPASAGTGAVTAGAGMAWVAAGAVGGGLLTAMAIWVLLVRTSVHGAGLVLVGIGVTAMLSAVNVLLLTRAEERAALRAALWGAGSLNGVDGGWILPCLVTLALVAVAVSALARSARVFELGPDAAGALGVSPARFSLLAMATGVVLAALATAVAGPISFVALAAPQIARRVWGSGSVPFAASALTGAVLLLASDVLAQRLLAPTIIPTGLVTTCLGGAYLAWALTRGRRP